MEIKHSIPYLEQLFEGVYLVDRDRRILYWNSAAEKISGFTASEVVGKKCRDNILVHVDEKGTILCNNGCPLEMTMRDGVSREAGVFLRHKAGHRVPVTVRSIPLRDENGLIQCSMEVFTRYSLTSDVNQLKELARKAFIDAWTGLPNRDYIETKLSSLLAVSAMGELNRWGILLIEILNFPEIEQLYEGKALQASIQVAARTLKENLVAGELVARWDRNAFIAVTRIDKRLLLLNWAARIKSLLERSSVVGYDSLVLSVATGGLIAAMGRNVAEVIEGCERELANARSSLGHVSVRED